MAAMYVGKMPAAISSIQADLGISLIEGGYVISVFNLIAVLFAMLIGVTLDMLNKRRLIFVSFCTLAIGGVVGSFAESYMALMLSRILEGCGYIFVVVAMPAIVSDASSDKDRAMTMSIWSIYTPLGMVLGLVSFPLLEPHVHWQGAWQFYSTLPVLSCLAVLWAVRRFPMAEKPVGNVFVVVWQTLSQKSLWVLSFAFIGFVVQWMSIMAWLPTILVEDLSFDKKTAAFITASIIALNIPGNIFGGWLMVKGVPVRYLVISGTFLMSLTTLGVFIIKWDAVFTIACCYVFSLVSGVVPACLFSCIHKCSPSLSHINASSGMIMQGAAIGQFIGPPLLAYAVSFSGGQWSAGIYPIIVGACVTIVMGWIVTRPD